MTHNIIKTENYLLVVDDSEIKEGDWIYKSNSNTLNIAGKGYHNFTKSDAKITAHLPLNNSPVLKGVPLLPPLEDGETMCPYPEEKQNAIDWHNGYNKAKEKYKYTEEDLRKVIYMARETLEYDENRGWYNTKSEDKIIQSLQQQKMPVAFECEMENKIAIDGHTVIGSEPKTTTNSQGQTVLAGKYIY
jgi:hypothetical protein